MVMGLGDGTTGPGREEDVVSRIETEEEKRLRRLRGFFARQNAKKNDDTWSADSSDIQQGDRLQRRYKPPRKGQKVNAEVYWQEYGILNTPANAANARTLISTYPGYYRVVRGWFADRPKPRVIAQ
jgi:hypothetical protein